MATRVASSGLCHSSPPDVVRGPLEQRKRRQCTTIHCTVCVTNGETRATWTTIPTRKIFTTTERMPVCLSRLRVVATIRHETHRSVRTTTTGLPIEIPEIPGRTGNLKTLYFCPECLLQRLVRYRTQFLAYVTLDGRVFRPHVVADLLPVRIHGVIALVEEQYRARG